MLKLTQENEELRDTLFHSIFRGTLVFDDIRSAVDYKKSLIAQQKGPPPIFTMEGDKLTADGMMNPKKGQGKLPDRLEYIFGQQRPDSSEEFKRLEAGA
jgi:hypothetical protein